MKIYVVMCHGEILIATDNENQASQLLGDGRCMEVWEEGRYVETLESSDNHGT